MCYMLRLGLARCDVYIIYNDVAEGLCLGLDTGIGANIPEHFCAVCIIACTMTVWSLRHLGIVSCLQGIMYP